MLFLFEKKPIFGALLNGDGLSPRFYGLQKIHKTRIFPLRLIVSFVNSPNHVESSGTGFVTNCWKSENIVKNYLVGIVLLRILLLINAEDELVSFDVISLFTHLLIMPS